MAKTVVQHDEDPGIAIVLECDDESGSWFGSCTECSYVTRVASLADAQQEAEIHIDLHESAL
jgi:hypothetical protein